MKMSLLIVLVSVILAACNPTTRDMPLVSTDALLPAPTTSRTKTILIREQPSIRATLLVADNVLSIQYGNGKQQRLIGITPTLYAEFPSKFLQISDKNRDGLKEVAVLVGTNLGASEWCYDVFHYNLNQALLERRWEDFYCTSH